MVFSSLGDRAILITLGDSIDEATHRRVRAVTARIDAEPPDGFVDRVPAFASVVVHYEPLLVSATGGRSPNDTFVEALRRLLADVRDDDLPPPRVVDIPVCYGGELGPDLEDVARQHGLAVQEVIDIHAAGDYLVYMVGFMPGFAYLGGLSDRIA